MSRRTATARSACGSSVRYGAPVPLRNAGSTRGAGAGSGRGPARKRQEIPEDRRIDAHRARCTVYVRPDWPGNVTAPWPSFEAGKTRRSSPSARTGSAKPAPPSAKSRCNPVPLLAGEDFMPIPRVAVVRRVRRVGARDLGHLGVGQLPVEIVASLAIRRIRPVRNGSYGRLQYPHDDDCSLIFRCLSRHPRPDPPYARPCRDDPGAFPERDRTLTEPRTCVKARRLRAVEVTNEDSVAAPAERQPSGGEVPAGLLRFAVEVGQALDPERPRGERVDCLQQRNRNRRR